MAGYLGGLGAGADIIKIGDSVICRKKNVLIEEITDTLAMDKTKLR